MTDVINAKIVELVEQGYSIRKIGESVGLSYSAIRNRLKNLNLHTHASREHNEGLCIMCNNPLTGLQVKYCSNKCKSKSHTGNTKEAQFKRGVLRKLAFVKELGGKCQKCGYNKNLASLCFHHRDPNQKSLWLDRRSLSNNSEKVLRAELVKCDLLCHNCHTELHHPRFNIDVLDASAGVEPAIF